MASSRALQPELLDSLRPDDPEALRNRRDLRLLNRLMGTHRWFARVVPGLLRPGECALEIGAGTGELGLSLAARGLAVDGLDLWPRPPDWPAGREWHRHDLRAFPGYGRYPVLIASLILHQFSDDELGALGRSLPDSVRAVVACEPRRSRAALWGLRLAAAAFRFGRVTRHDGAVSIAAGFRGGELPRALGLGPPLWKISRESTALGACRMVAVRCCS